MISASVRSLKRVSVSRPAFALLLSLPWGANAAQAQTRVVRETLEWSAAGAALGGAVVLDHIAREVLYLRADSTLPILATIADRAGRRNIYFVSLAAFYARGIITDDQKLSRGALHTTEALLITGLATGALKYVAGRGRPDTNGADGNDFRPIGRSDPWSSFPSGHTVTAFTVATAIAEEVGNPWVTGVSYGLASVVGWSRIRADRHWMSDVVAGAILGTALTQATFRYLHRNETDEERPVVGGSSPVLLVFSVPVR